MVGVAAMSERSDIVRSTKSIRASLFRIKKTVLKYNFIILIICNSNCFLSLRIATCQKKDEYLLFLFRSLQNIYRSVLASHKHIFPAKQDACTGVHSACQREENGHNLDICVLRRLRLRQGQMQGFLGLKVGGGGLICKYGI